MRVLARTILWTLCVHVETYETTEKNEKGIPELSVFFKNITSRVSPEKSLKNIGGLKH